MITAIADAYQGVAELKVFASWPDDIVRCPLRPMYRPCGDVLKAGPALATGPRCSVEQAIRNAADSVHWLEPYAATAIGQGFADTFGCYAILRNAAPFQSSKLRIWMTYMPPNLCYPWHHHPAEEMYFVVSDTAVFQQDGCDDKALQEGDIVFHSRNQRHAMYTNDTPGLCLVFWRDEFDTPPVLSS